MVFLEISQNSQENTWARDPFLKLQALIETLAQAFSCEFSEISKNAFLTEHVWATVSIFLNPASVLLNFLMNWASAVA